MSFLKITPQIVEADRAAAAAVYETFKQPFLDTVGGAQSKQLLLREDDVQVLHGFGSMDCAQKYLASDLFNQDVVTALAPLLKAEPEIRIYDTV